jgi:hypothetical protein
MLSRTLSQLARRAATRCRMHAHALAPSCTKLTSTQSGSLTTQTHMQTTPRGRILSRAIEISTLQSATSIPHQQHYRMTDSLSQKTIPIRHLSSSSSSSSEKKPPSKTDEPELTEDEKFERFLGFLQRRGEITDMTDPDDISRGREMFDVYVEKQKRIADEKRMDELENEIRTRMALEKLTEIERAFNGQKDSIKDIDVINGMLMQCLNAKSMSVFPFARKLYAFARTKFEPNVYSFVIYLSMLGANPEALHQDGLSLHERKTFDQDRKEQTQLVYDEMIESMRNHGASFFPEPSYVSRCYVLAALALGTLNKPTQLVNLFKEFVGDRADDASSTPKPDIPPPLSDLPMTTEVTRDMIAKREAEVRKLESSWGVSSEVIATTAKVLCQLDHPQGLKLVAKAITSHPDIISLGEPMAATAHVVAAVAESESVSEIVEFIDIVRIALPDQKATVPYTMLLNVAHNDGGRHGVISVVKHIRSRALDLDDEHLVLAVAKALTHFASRTDVARYVAEVSKVGAVIPSEVTMLIAVQGETMIRDIINDDKEAHEAHEASRKKRSNKKRGRRRN